MWIRNALVVAEFVEYTPVRYKLWLQSGVVQIGEWFCERGASASGLSRSSRRDG